MADVADYTQAVNVTGGSVSITGTATVQITGTPTVSISGTPTVNVGNTPAVTINSGTVTATISGTPNINIQSQSVTISTNQPLQTLADLSFPGSSTSTQTTATVPAGTHSLALSNPAGAPLNTFKVNGHQSGIQYFPSLPTGPSFNLNINARVVFPVDSARDTTYDVTATNPGGSAQALHVTAVLDTQAVSVSNLETAPLFAAIVDTTGGVLTTSGFAGGHQLDSASLPVVPATPTGTWTVTSVAVGALATVQIIAANPNRRGLIILVGGGITVNVLLHGAANPFTQQVALATWVMPTPVTTAALDVQNQINAAGSVLVTEIT